MNKIAFALAVVSVSCMAQSDAVKARLQRTEEARKPIVVTNKFTKYEWRLGTNSTGGSVSNLIAITPMGRTNRQFVIESKPAAK